jgi:hypothetical protein
MKEDLIKSNQKIIELINSNKPFTVIRLGIGSETYMSYEFYKTHKLNPNYLHPETRTLYNAGIYTRDGNLYKMSLFCGHYLRAIKYSDAIASFTKIIDNQENFFSKEFNIPQINSRAVEPFYTILENKIPWTHTLKGKKVLVIHPFIDSFKKQQQNNFQLFSDSKLFLEDQEFKFYKTFQTIAGNHIHNDWEETYNIMCDEISKIDFDIALLGCGGYGLPLCNFIKEKLNKSAIYVGGGLQLLFGVMGSRWDNDFWNELIKKHNIKFIRPSGNEICNNLQTIENGCYW